MKKGFTVIEVSLVLAIAGLIFMMVFVVLPALQRSSRDTTRRDDMSDFIAAVKKYQTNNRGALPGGGDDASKVISVSGYSGSSNDTTWQGFYDKYLGDNFIDPSGEAYRLEVVKCNGQTGTDCGVREAGNGGLMDYTLLVVTQATCSGETAAGSSNPRNLAVLYRLEGSGIACANT